MPRVFAPRSSSPELYAPFRQGLRRYLGSVAAVLAGLLVLDRLFPPPLAALHRQPSVAVLAADGEPLRFFLAPDDHYRLPIELDEVPPELVSALVAAEDQRFWRHPGVDPWAVVRAMISNLRAGKVVSGASTLPMQIARLAQPGPRTLGSKLREATRAVQLELRFSKRELLETYLNLAPYGGNIQGVGAASWLYFGKRPAQLSLGEIALLVVLPRSPTAFDPTRNPTAARAARDAVLDRLGAAGVFPAERLAAARRQDVSSTRQPLPFAAPHFSLLASRRAGAHARVATTLDRRLQAAAEQVVRGRIPALREVGVGNAAAVVIEIESRSLVALVGSAGFFEEAFDGQVNGALARRSPGSTLKPFLYALAYDQGRIVPDSYLLDVPTDFGGYVAENYDGTYHGRVTAREALVSSLNSPAVRLLADLGVPSFLDLLHRGGLATLDRPAAKYGLPLVLGGGEVTLLDLTNLYATLAEGGEPRPLHFLADAATTSTATPQPEPAPPLFSRRAAELVTRTLVDLARPDLPASWDLARGVPAVAWKTGTSFGHRDAWAMGFSGRYAIGVWVGNFGGRPVKGISGSEHAGPILFDLFRALGDDTRPALLGSSPVGDDTLEVCAESRELPGPYCPRRMRVPYLPGKTRLPACRMHKRVFVDRETGEILAGPCLAQRPFVARVLALDPPELVAFWRAQGRVVEPVAAVSPRCGGPPAGEPPKIVSPAGGAAYRTRRDAPLGFQRIPLIARAGSFAHKLYWYQDGALVATGSPADRLFLEPIPGRHELVVVDDTGRADSLRYRVE